MAVQFSVREHKICLGIPVHEIILNLLKNPFMIWVIIWD